MVTSAMKLELDPASRLRYSPPSHRLYISKARRRSPLCFQQPPTSFSCNSFPLKFMRKTPRGVGGSIGIGIANQRGFCSVLTPLDSTLARNVPSCANSGEVTPLESIANFLSPLESYSYEEGAELPQFAANNTFRIKRQFAKSFRVHSYEKCTSKSFRIRSYEM
jgi:hypothetical protein